MKAINDFARKFDANVLLDSDLIVEKQNRYYLLNQSLKRLITKEFFFAGTYLGKIKDGKFFPSFNLLTTIAKQRANKTTVDEKTEWLFICGRDIFKQGILNIEGSKRKGNYTLIMSQHNECLGFGRIIRNIEEEKNEKEVVVRNISDIGDFLRREQ